VGEEEKNDALAPGRHLKITKDKKRWENRAVAGGEKGGVKGAGRDHSEKELANVEEEGGDISQIDDDRLEKPCQQRKGGPDEWSRVKGGNARKEDIVFLNGFSEVGRKNSFHRETGVLDMNRKEIEVGGMNKLSPRYERKTIGRVKSLNGGILEKN